MLFQYLAERRLDQLLNNPRSPARVAESLRTSLRNVSRDVVDLRERILDNVDRVSLKELVN